MTREPDITGLDEFLFKAVPRLINVLPNQGLRHAEQINKEPLFHYSICDQRIKELSTRAAFDGDGQLRLPARNFRFSICAAELEVQGAVISVAGSTMSFTVMQVATEPSLMFIFMPDQETGFKGWSFVMDAWDQGVREIPPDQCWACMQGVMALCIEAKPGTPMTPSRDAQKREYFSFHSGGRDQDATTAFPPAQHQNN
jgi:hypothetical protein